jgi:hypothetical protein
MHAERAKAGVDRQLDAAWWPQRDRDNHDGKVGEDTQVTGERQQP